MFFCSHKNRVERALDLVLFNQSQLARQLNTIMSQNDDLLAAASALSTASDALSVKTDGLVSKVDAVVSALQNNPTPVSPAVTAAIAALQVSATSAAAAGDKVDAEVTKLDTVLPTPAPAAPVVGP